MITKIQIEQFEENFKCECENTSFDSGFFPCDNNGKIIEPTNDWEGLYICADCGKIYKIYY